MEKGLGQGQGEEGILYILAVRSRTQNEKEVKVYRTERRAGIYPMGVPIEKKRRNKVPGS